MNYNELSSIEPRLKDVICAAKTVVDITGNKNLAYTTAKNVSDRLVGYGAEKPELRSSYAYNVFINHICKEIGL